MKVIKVLLLTTVLFLLSFAGGLWLKKTEKHLMQEYQVRIERDSAFVYQRGRFVGAYRYPRVLTGFDLIIALDNR